MADLRTMNENKKSKTDSMSRVIMMNPIIRRMEAKTKNDVASENCATYKGIGLKTLFFLILTLGGAGLFFLLHHILVDNVSASQVIAFSTDVFKVRTSLPEIGILCAVLFVDLVFPFIAWFVKGAVPIVGTIYSVAQGMLVGFITAALGAQYGWLAVLALVLTFAIVGTMLFLYTSRIVRVTATFRRVMFTIFGSLIIGGILLFIMYFIPGLNIVAASISSILHNPVVSIITSIIFIILASLFLLADFNAIEECVERKMDKSYEWMASFGLAYTIIYLYFKILNLLITIFARND